jgi:hypothetical protein
MPHSACGFYHPGPCSLVGLLSSSLQTSGPWLVMNLDVLLVNKGAISEMVWVIVNSTRGGMSDDVTSPGLHFMSHTLPSLTMLSLKANLT